MIIASIRRRARKTAVVGLLLASVSVAMLSCAQKREAPVTAQRIILRDETGHERAVLVIGEDQARLSIRGEQGESIFDFSLSADGLTIELVDETGETHSATITAEPLEP